MAFDDYDGAIDPFDDVEDEELRAILSDEKDIDNDDYFFSRQRLDDTTAPQRDIAREVFEFHERERMWKEEEEIFGLDDD